MTGVLADGISGVFKSEIQLVISDWYVLHAKASGVASLQGPHRRFGKICFARKVVIEKVEEEI
jgi:hypothetical protein